MADVFRTFQPPVAAVLDKVGRPLSPGDAIFIMGKTDTIWSVYEITPVLDPKLPPGAMAIVLTSSYRAIVQRNTPLPDVLLVLSAEEQAGRTGLQAPPPAEETKQ